MTNVWEARYQESSSNYHSILSLLSDYIWPREVAMDVSYRLQRRIVKTPEMICLASQVIEGFDADRV